VLLTELVETSAAVATAPGRRVKIAEIAGLLRRVPPGEVAVAVAFLSGELRQRQIGVGYAALTSLLRAGQSMPGNPAAAPAPPAEVPPAEVPPAAGPPAEPALTLTDTDAAFEAIGTVTGPGSQADRRRLLGGLFSRATPQEQEFLVRLIAGDLRQGALEGVMTEAIAQAAEVPADEVRRAHQLGGSLTGVARAALGGSGLAALRGFRLQIGHPVRPMLAASAPDVATALERVSPAALEWKIDGIRVQVHKDHDQVTVFTRTLEDITARVPEIAEAIGALDAGTAVLDGEAVALYPDGQPRPFQVTSARTASQTDLARQRAETPLTPFLFDLLHLNGTDLIDAPGRERYQRLSVVAPAGLIIPRVVTSDPAAALSFFRDAVSHGHEGVVVKSLDAPYVAGRRGSEWIKVKPRHTLDLVVLAAEWGHGRRRGLLSNLHLGAREPATGDLVMLGKTFKGLTDEMLAWQTARLLDLADPPRPQLTDADRTSQYGTVRVRPELVLEIAFDGVQASRRYPGGLALRFARVVRYRPDKSPAEADTIDDVRAIWSHGEAPGRS
jgi:ATP-dependent DNA ligase I